MKLELLCGMIFIIIGVIFFIVEIVKKKKCKVTTNATVIDIARDQSRDSDGSYSTTLHPVFEYEVSGNIYVKKSRYGSSSCKYYIGQQVEILYNEKNPNQYYVKGSLSGIMFGVVCLVAGIISIFWN